MFPSNIFQRTVLLGTIFQNRLAFLDTLRVNRSTSTVALIRKFGFPLFVTLFVISRLRIDKLALDGRGNWSTRFFSWLPLSHWLSIDTDRQQSSGQEPKPPWPNPRPTSV